MPVARCTSHDVEVLKQNDDVVVSKLMINHIKTSLLKKIPVEVDKLCENLYFSSNKNPVVNAIESNSVQNSLIIVWSKLIIES